MRFGPPPMIITFFSFCAEFELKFDSAQFDARCGSLVIFVVE